MIAQWARPMFRRKQEDKPLIKDRKLESKVGNYGVRGQAPGSSREYAGSRSK
jgi:hypothetical protein